MNKKISATGSALLTSLFMMALVAIAATAIATRVQLDIYRARLTIQRDQLILAIQGVTFWAMDWFKDDRFSVHEKQETLPKALQNIYPPIKLKGEIYDLQARFNLNN